MFGFSDQTLHIIQNVMGPLGGLLAGVMFLSSIPVMRYIVRTKGVGEYSCFPYVVQTCNCALWSTYSLTDWQQPGGATMLWPLVTNGFGLVVASVSFVVYICYTGDKFRGLLPYFAPPLLLTCGFCVFALVAMNHTVATITGDCCLAINMIMYLGPCAGIKEAISTRSTEFLPLSLGISTITCSVPWLLFGICLSNLNIYIPNGCGVVFGSVQVGVYAWLTRGGAVPNLGCSVALDDGVGVAPKTQNYATAGNLFSFITAGKIDARSLRQVQTWAGSSPLCSADGTTQVEEGEALPRANSAPSMPSPSLPRTTR